MPGAVGTPLAAVDAAFFQLELTGIPPTQCNQVTLPSNVVQLPKTWETQASGRLAYRRTAAVDMPGGKLMFGGDVTPDMSIEKWIDETSQKGITGSGQANVKEGMLSAFNVAGEPTAAWKLEGVVIEALSYTPVSTAAGSHMEYTATLDVLRIERTK